MRTSCQHPRWNNLNVRSRLFCEGFGRKINVLTQKAFWWRARTVGYFGIQFTSNLPEIGSRGFAGHKAVLVNPHCLVFASNDCLIANYFGANMRRQGFIQNGNNFSQVPKFIRV